MSSGTSTPVFTWNESMLFPIPEEEWDPKHLQEVRSQKRERIRMKLAEEESKQSNIIWENERFLQELDLANVSTNPNPNPSQRGTTTNPRSRSRSRSTPNPNPNPTLMGNDFYGIR